MKVRLKDNPDIIYEVYRVEKNGVIIIVNGNLIKVSNKEMDSVEP